MAKFRKKPVVIDAVQYIGGEYVPGVGYTPDSALPFCETLEGRLYVSPGDWIVKGIKGEYYPVKPDIFAATYEAVSE